MLSSDEEEKPITFLASTSRQVRPGGHCSWPSHKPGSGFETPCTPCKEAPSSSSAGQDLQTPPPRQLVKEALSGQKLPMTLKEWAEAPPEVRFAAKAGLDLDSQLEL
ncbi:unnamed protein product [Effrenium voratum]|uniref:Uncharacterized protein n=1 Tax=Effrenium voratum TaxID=2562239 RepID=A0AA36MX88_9DINO|nr:unnamed protein product [Effrenium voratum]